MTSNRLPACPNPRAMRRPRATPSQRGAASSRCRIRLPPEPSKNASCRSIQRSLPDAPAIAPEPQISFQPRPALRTDSSRDRLVPGAASSGAEAGSAAREMGRQLGPRRFFQAKQEAVPDRQAVASRPGPAPARTSRTRGDRRRTRARNTLVAGHPAAEAQVEVLDPPGEVDRVVPAELQELPAIDGQDRAGRRGQVGLVERLARSRARGTCPGPGRTATGPASASPRTPGRRTSSRAGRRRGRRRAPRRRGAGGRPRRGRA